MDYYEQLDKLAKEEKELHYDIDITEEFIKIRKQFKKTLEQVKEDYYERRWRARHSNEAIELVLNSNLDKKYDEHIIYLARFVQENTFKDFLDTYDDYPRTQEGVAQAIKDKYEDDVEVVGYTANSVVFLDKAKFRGE